MSSGTRKLVIAGSIVLLVAGAVLLWSWWTADSFHERYDAEHVGSEVCGECHSYNHAAWSISPHANMVREPSAQTVIGDFNNGSYRLPDNSPDALAGEVVARTYTRGDRFIMALRHPERAEWVEFPIELVIGYQYRQEYVFPERAGVLRRLPLQWSTARQAFFPYWNVQEGSDQTLADLWAQMRTTNSAWNLYCARCHTTNLEILQRAPGNARGHAQWSELGISCEACHGPGSLHSAYMKASPANRLAMWMQNHLQGRPVAYIASADKMPKGQALSVCARCHGADIFANQQDTYRTYQPGYSREGRTNDLSHIFYELPMTPSREFPTLEVWANGAPRGIGMLFRSFVESDCYREAEVRCYDCHDPHNNKAPTDGGILHASAVSNAYCGECHDAIAADPQAHTHHAEGQAGSFCYDCHMPYHLTKLNRGIWERGRAHDMSAAPRPVDSQRFGLQQAPNACNDCHTERDPKWATQISAQWWPGSQQ